MKQRLEIIEAAAAVFMTCAALAGCGTKPQVQMSPVSQTASTPAIPATSPIANAPEADDKAIRARLDKRFSVAQRKAIYTALGNADNHAIAEAQKQSPRPAETYKDAASEAQFDRYRTVESALERKYHTAVGRQYGIDAQQIEALENEGLESHWPSPNGEGIDVPVDGHS